ncbi:DUF2800 domain-containing protein [Luteimonas sp. FXH3W]|uniref:DUF2800 domain-containing protein n=1 Tax=Aquilutibacter rugosus TaxID=3115820 RepID=A0ABU7V2S3_9GAMM
MTVRYNVAMEHSLFSASAAERWLACPGTIHLCKDIPDRKSAAAEEGSRLHTLAEHCLRNDDDPKLGVLFQGSAVTAEHVDWVQTYLDHVRSLGGHLLIEQKINYATPLGLDHQLAFGTCDAVRLDGTHLHIIDAKFGRGPVSAMRNKQLTLYAAGFAHALESVGREISHVDLHIVQPRVTTQVQPYALTRSQLHSSLMPIRRGAQLAHDALIHAGSMDAQTWSSRFLRRGERQCRWCPARGGCPAW